MEAIRPWDWRGLLNSILRWKKYYKDIEDKENIIFKNMYEDTEETVYVTSIIFEPEPEFDENKSTDKHVYNKEDVEYVQLIIE